MYKIEQTNVSSATIRLQKQFDNLIISLVYKIIMYGPHDERSYNKTRGMGCLYIYNIRTNV